MSKDEFKIDISGVEGLDFNLADMIPLDLDEDTIIKVSLLFLDQSTSMTPVASAARRAANDHLAAVQEDSHALHIICMVGLNGTPQVLIAPQLASEVEPLTSYDLNPGSPIYMVVDLVMRNLMRDYQYLGTELQKHFQIFAYINSDGQDEEQYRGCSPRPTFPDRTLEITSQASQAGWRLKAVGINGINGRQLARNLGFDPELAETMRPGRRGTAGSTVAYTRLVTEERKD